MSIFIYLCNIIPSYIKNRMVMKTFFTIVTMAFMVIDISAQRLIAEIDWTKQDAYYYVMYAVGNSIYVEKGVGLIIESDPSDGVYYWEVEVPIIAQIPSLKKGGQYQVKYTAVAPTAGEIRLDLCSWDGSGATYANVIKVEAGEKENVVDFPDYPTDCIDCMLFYQCGHLSGKHIIKKVQVFEITGDVPAAIKANKRIHPDNAIYNIAGQKVNDSYKGIIIQKGKKVIVK